MSALDWTKPIKFSNGQICRWTRGAASPFPGCPRSVQWEDESGTHIIYVRDDGVGPDPLLTVINRTKSEYVSVHEWQRWFAWFPVKACGKWRWLAYVNRRRVSEEQGIKVSYLEEEWPYEYQAGDAHDYPDGELGEPAHFYTHSCKHCGEKFTI